VSVAELEGVRLVLRLLAKGALLGLVLLGTTVTFIDWVVTRGWLSVVIVSALTAAFWFWKRRPLWGLAAFGAVATFLGGASVSMILVFWSGGVALLLIGSLVRWAWPWLRTQALSGGRIRWLCGASGGQGPAGPEATEALCPSCRRALWVAGGASEGARTPEGGVA
jgi:hypothetical protein